MNTRLGKVLALTMVMACMHSHANEDIVTPPEHRRGADQTFLTFPEWYLVYSPAEYAQTIAVSRPSSFPWFSHIGDFWRSYRDIYRRISDEFAFNGEYHVMVMVIGVSTTLEYGIRGAYEATIGRLFESTTRAGAFTEEEVLAATVAQEYVDFIYERPWYEFDFPGALRRLWAETSFFGPDMLRKLERKYVLTTEYLVKSAYAWLIGRGAAASFDAPIHETAVVLASQPAAVQMLPRYQPFTAAAAELALAGEDFVEIAGNRGRVVISLWADDAWSATAVRGDTLVRQSITHRPGQSRYVVELDVAALGAALRQIDASGLKLEHIYDF